MKKFDTWSKVDHDIKVGSNIILNKDIPEPASPFILMLPDLGFIRDENGDARTKFIKTDPDTGEQIEAPGIIVPEDSVNSEVYNCCTGKIIAISGLAFHHRDYEDLRGEPWIGNYPKLGDRVIWRDGGVGQHNIINGIDLFNIVDVDIRLIISDELKVKGYFSNQVNSPNISPSNSIVGA